MQVCELCGRAASPLTRHHLFPRSRHNKPRFQRLHSKEIGREAIAMLCRACHSCVHAHLSEKELEREFNTVESLRAHPSISQFVAWLSRKPADFHPSVRRPKRFPRG